MNQDITQLEERFTQPPGWTWESTEHTPGRKLRYGFVSPDAPAALIVALPGLNEVAEKYFEIARHYLAQNYAVCVIDFFGQGGSGRYIESSTKRHSNSFDHNIDDLEHVLQSLPDALTSLPKIMLAHSMGANIGTRYLAAHPGTFALAGMSAPLYGIATVSDLPRFVQTNLSAFLNAVIGKTYVTFHGMANRRKNRKFDGNPLSSDHDRFRLMESWMAHNEQLRADDVTFGWVYHALRSCFVIEKQASTIQNPIFYALAGDDEIVHNPTARRVIATIKNAETIEIKGAKHEILMERDELRDQFFNRFDQKIRETVS